MLIFFSLFSHLVLGSWFSVGEWSVLFLLLYCREDRGNWSCPQVGWSPRKSHTSKLTVNSVHLAPSIPVFRDLSVSAVL